MSSDLLECQFKWKKNAIIMQILMLAVSWHCFLQRINLSPVKQKRIPLKMMRWTRSEIDLCKVRKCWKYCGLCKWFKKNKKKGRKKDQSILKLWGKKVKLNCTRRSYFSIKTLYYFWFCKWNKLRTTLKEIKNAMCVKMGPSLAWAWTFSNCCDRNTE